MSQVLTNQKPKKRCWKQPNTVAAYIKIFKTNLWAHFLKDDCCLCGCINHIHLCACVKIMHTSWALSLASMNKFIVNIGTQQDSADTTQVKVKVKLPIFPTLGDEIRLVTVKTAIMYYWFLPCNIPMYWGLWCLIVYMCINRAWAVYSTLL